MRKIVILVAILFLSGCGMFNFPVLNAPRAPQQVYNYRQIFEKNPTAVVMDGKIVVVESQKQTLDVQYDNKEKPLSWWQRFCNWLGNLGFISILLLIAGLVIAPAGTLGFLWQRYTVFKRALTQTVRAIDESKAVDTVPEVKAALAASHDDQTKRLIDDIKRS